MNMILTFGTVVLGIVAFIVVLGIIILVHEGGHFLFARKYGILCREFSFGMGPQLVHHKKGETDYSIRAFPIGGFCAIAGEEAEDNPLKDSKQVRLVIENGIIQKICFEIDSKLFKDIPLFDLKEYDLFDKEDTGKLYMTVVDANGGEMTLPVDKAASYLFHSKMYKKQEIKDSKTYKKYAKEFQIAPHNRTLNAKKKGQRVMVMVGGPMMNFILAIIVFFLSALIGGVSNTTVTTLSEVSNGTPAYEAGLREDYELESFTFRGNEYTLENWEDISSTIDKYAEGNDYVDIVIKYTDAAGEEQTTSLKPMVAIYSVSMYQDINSDEVKVAELDSSSKAYKAGVRTGDIITKVNGEDVSTWLDVYHSFEQVTDEGVSVTMDVTRDGESVDDISVIPYSKDLFEKTQAVSYVDLIIGISPSVTHNLWKSLGDGFTKMYTSIKSMIFTLGLLIGSNEVGVKDLSGPVGIFSMTSSAAQRGIAYLLYWLGFLSVNIGFINLLPIPALDGGRILFVIIEAIRKKAVSEKAQTIAINVTYYALLALIVYVTFNDVLRIVK